MSHKKNILFICASTNQVCPPSSGNLERIHWNITDPFRGWNLDTNQMDSFREIRSEIKSRINSFIDLH